MDFGSSYLPTETVDNILRCLSVKDNKNVRLVSKGFSVIASPVPFESLYISTRLKDREIFTAVSEHPLLSQLVREVIYDSTNIAFAEGVERFALNRASYTRFLSGRPHFNSSTGSISVRHSKAAIHRGFEIFLQHFFEQNKMASYTGDDMAHNGTLPTPANFSSLVMDQKSHHDVVRYLPDDLVRLIHGLPRMPGVRRFKITDCRYSQKFKPRERTNAAGSNIAIKMSVSINNEGVRGIDEVILNPRPWMSRKEQGERLGCRPSWYRGFLVLAQAASMTNMGTLNSFKVERDCKMGGLSHVVFGMTQRELYHTTNAFSNLTTIQLKIQTGDLHGKIWEETMRRGDLARILGAAKHLEILDLRMDVVNANPVHFAEIIGTHSWPRLRKVTLATMMLAADGNGFLEFFERHRYTLHSLWLEEILIVTLEQAHRLYSRDGKVYGIDYATERKTEPLDRWSSWDKILRAMAFDALALTNITYFENNFGTHPIGWVFHSCNPATVFGFLRSGGMNRPTVPCQHRERSFWFEEDQ